MSTDSLPIEETDPDQLQMVDAAPTEIAVSDTAAEPIDDEDVGTVDDADEREEDVPIPNEENAESEEEEEEPAAAAAVSATDEIANDDITEDDEDEDDDLPAGTTSAPEEDEEEEEEEESAQPIQTNTLTTPSPPALPLPTAASISSISPSPAPGIVDAASAVAIASVSPHSTSSSPLPGTAASVAAQLGSLATPATLISASRSSSPAKNGAIPAGTVRDVFALRPPTLLHAHTHPGFLSPHMQMGGMQMAHAHAIHPGMAYAAGYAPAAHGHMSEAAAAAQAQAQAKHGTALHGTHPTATSQQTGTFSPALYMPMTGMHGHAGMPHAHTLPLAGMGYLQQHSLPAHSIAVNAAGIMQHPVAAHAQHYQQYAGQLAGITPHHLTAQHGGVIQMHTLTPQQQQQMAAQQQQQQHAAAQQQAILNDPRFASMRIAQQQQVQAAQHAQQVQAQQQHHQQQTAALQAQHVQQQRAMFSMMTEEQAAMHTAVLSEQHATAAAAANAATGVKDAVTLKKEKQQRRRSSVAGSDSRATSPQVDESLGDSDALAAGKKARARKRKSSVAPVVIPEEQSADMTVAAASSSGAVGTPAAKKQRRPPSGTALLVADPTSALANDPGLMSGSTSNVGGVGRPPATPTPGTASNQSGVTAPTTGGKKRVPTGNRPGRPPGVKAGKQVAGAGGASAGTATTGTPTPGQRASARLVSGPDDATAAGTSSVSGSVAAGASTAIPVAPQGGSLDRQNAALRAQFPQLQTGRRPRLHERGGPIAGNKRKLVFFKLKAHELKPRQLLLIKRLLLNRMVAEKQLARLRLRRIDALGLPAVEEAELSAMESALNAPPLEPKLTAKDKQQARKRAERQALEDAAQREREAAEEAEAAREAAEEDASAADDSKKGKRDADAKRRAAKKKRKRGGVDEEGDDDATGESVAAATASAASTAIPVTAKETESRELKRRKAAANDAVNQELGLQTQMNELQDALGKHQTEKQQLFEALKHVLNREQKAAAKKRAQEKKDEAAAVAATGGGTGTPIPSQQQVGKPSSTSSTVSSSITGGTAKPRMGLSLSSQDSQQQGGKRLMIPKKRT
jgi:hypothetical protein